MERIALRYTLSIALISLLSLGSCKPNSRSGQDQPQQESVPEPANTKVEQPTEIKEETEESEEPAEETAEEFRLSSENALGFFKDYAEHAREDKVEFTTSLGSFTIELFNNVPYHRANMIFLSKQHYFDTTQFHRVVRDFIIQGGNSDDIRVYEKRKEIGLYLLPPDPNKGYRHHRGIISMPSAEQFRSYKKASPYEFFIVVSDPGAYHLDGDYTPFGRVIDGMDVVDRINRVQVDQGDWPLQNVYIWSARAFR